ncbi:hypothetical protein SAMN05660293_00701 [Dyadobacter psychrophilus]|uniref:Uncharacterized protein n=1 Tax=Dyadobacter psychrophilus TaxID=651661 RepID=A0A1T5BY05_9BACT|nr:hypothetical protein SAMN05660293_00701 [Dyadobacter psychrophilus]
MRVELGLKHSIAIMQVVQNSTMLPLLEIADRGVAFALAYSIKLTANICIIANNISLRGQTIDISSIDSWYPAPVFIFNHSLVQGFIGGGNQNLDGTVDPRFEIPLTGNFGPTASGNYRLKATSPCINKGANLV